MVDKDLIGIFMLTDLFPDPKTLYSVIFSMIAVS